MKISASTTKDKSSHVHQRRWLPIIGTQIVLKHYGRRSDLVIGTTIHELAHASHWSMDRENYNDLVWKGYIEAETIGMKRHNKRAKRLLETWATTVEIHLTKRLYQKKYLGTYRYGFLKDDLQRQLISGGETFDFYTTCGYDMIDNENQSLSDSRRPIDRVSGYTIKQLENALSGCDVWGEWKTKLKRSYDNDTENNLDELFNNWTDD